VDASNPYASPLAPHVATTDDLKLPPYPWLSNTLFIGLLLNAIPCIAVFALILYAAWLEMQLPGQDPFVGFEMLLGFGVLGAAAYWPLSSLALFVYSITVDRGTPWWILKAIVSSAMLLMFLLPCVLALVLA